MYPSVTLSSKSLEALTAKIINLANIMGYGLGDIVEEDDAEGVYTITITGSDAQDLQSKVYDLAKLVRTDTKPIKASKKK